MVLIVSWWSFFAPATENANDRLAILTLAADPTLEKVRLAELDTPYALRSPLPTLVFCTEFYL